MQFTTTTLLAILAILSAKAIAAPILTVSPTTMTTIIVLSTIISSSITAVPSITKRFESKDSFTTYIRHQGGRGGWDLMPPMAEREVEEDRKVCERISGGNGQCVDIVEEGLEEEEDRDLGDCIPGFSIGC